MKRTFALILSIAFVISLSVLYTYTSTGNDYATYFTQENSAELAMLPEISVTEFSIDVAIDDENNHDPSNYVKVYNFGSNDEEADIFSQFADVVSGEACFTDLLSDDYSYIYVHPDFKPEAEVKKDSVSGEWRYIGSEPTVGIIREKFPEIANTMADIVDYISLYHPNVDFDSIMLINGRPRINSFFIRFIENEVEYAVVFYWNDTAFENGSILEISTLIEKIEAKKYFAMKSNPDGLIEDAPGVSFNETTTDSKTEKIVPWVYIVITGGFVIACATISMCIIIRRVKR